MGIWMGMDRFLIIRLAQTLGRIRAWSVAFGYAKQGLERGHILSFRRYKTANGREVAQVD